MAATFGDSSATLKKKKKKEESDYSDYNYN